MEFKPPPLDYEYAITRIVQFIRDYFSRSGARLAVIGLSGGIDSSVTLVLTVKALGRDRVKALVMPDSSVTPREDVEDAIELAEMLGVQYYVIDIKPIVESYATIVPFFDWGHRIATGNLRARIRMNLLYYYANRFKGLVVGTGDKSELLLGYFTRYGDGGADILPIGDVYKTQVREMGRRLGVPERIVRKPSSPRLWPGHLAEEELGLKYDVIDAVLYRYVDLGMSISEIVEDTGLSEEVVRAIIKRVHAYEYKRKMPPIPRVSKWSLYHDWRNPIEHSYP